jgi:D-alanyl-D-alanine carboxypeptidase/D-alanyl-D-alanine-endopeptidase (penicillin-binding protein 4)
LYARAGTAVLVLAALGGCATRTPRPLAPPPVVNARDRHVRALQEDVARLLDVPALRRALVAVSVQSLTRGDVLFRYHADRLVMPASNMKLVTLAAAAERLGWDYAFDTTVASTTPIGPDGSLAGDLVIIGGGDPTIGGENGPADPILDTWAAQLWDRGLRRVEGRVIGDDNAFAERPLGPGWAWDDLWADYSAPVGALQANEDAAELDVTPAALAGLPASVVVRQPESGLLIESTVGTSDAGVEANVEVERAPGSLLLRVHGSVPVGSQPFARHVAVDNPTLYAARLFVSALNRRGIDVEGGAADIDDLSIGSVVVGPPLVVHRSAPLSEAALVLMKVSQNQYAETLLRVLGRNTAHPATPEDGRAAVLDVLSGWGIFSDSIVMADGSGLSRYNYLTADALGTILRKMYENPRHRAAWLRVLPVAGADGTLERRFTGPPLAGLLRAKTGTLSNVRALSGYLPAANGEMLAFSIVVNNVTGTRQDVEAPVDAALARLAAFTR